MYREKQYLEKATLILGCSEIPVEVLNTGGLCQDPIVVDSTVLKRLIDNLQQVSLSAIKEDFQDLLLESVDMDTLLTTLQEEIDFHRSIDSFANRKVDEVNTVGKINLEKNDTFDAM